MTTSGKYTPKEKEPSLGEESKAKESLAVDLLEELISKHLKLDAKTEETNNQNVIYATLKALKDKAFGKISMKTEPAVSYVAKLTSEAIISKKW